ncbi:putative quinone-oxidoreductase -like protein, chloroplastic [Capsicum annuum]|uniref:Quinone-oxidoreductase -like protein, chloroplastic n=1 Tax=Capsicum annuum TaxID=4072 RepID=A0A2G2ZHE8_CAPAN|nr:putative quinone-oxidoreductase -like protein, chloroplastic [Capsicum annuum]PHT81406.1 putative quinone-oxidoreductase -like protein, chloroplastic [Capsicum annuum]
MAGNVMHVVQYDSYDSGAAGLKHVEVPVPTPKKDEVLLKLEATSINPIDWKIQKGMLRPLLRPKFLFIPTTDVGGEVVEVGSNVKSFKRGDKVVAMVSTQNGGLLIAGLIALQAVVNAVGVKLDGTGPRNNILVTAASGGVSHYAFQLAKLGNTDVTATCGARNFDFVKSLGADEVLNYKTPEGAALKSPPGQKYDAVIHFTTGIPWSTFEPNFSVRGKVIDLTPGAKAMWSVDLCSKKVNLLKNTVGATAFYSQ